MTASPRLLSIAARTTPEARLRELGKALVAARKAHEALLYAPTVGMDDEALAAREIELAKTRKAYLAADRALNEAV